MTLVATPPGGTTLRITVNGTRLFTGRIAGLSPTEPWHEELDLSQLALTDHLVVELASGSYQPNERFGDEVDTRRLGVALASVDLIGSTSDP